MNKPLNDKTITSDYQETAVRLVLNVTRATVIARFVHSKRIADFATVGTVELSVPGGLNAKGEGEIVLRVIPPAHGKGRKTGQSVERVKRICLDRVWIRPFVG